MGGGRSTISRRFGLYSQTIEDFTLKLNNSEELIEQGLAAPSFFHKYRFSGDRVPKRAIADVNHSNLQSPLVLRTQQQNLALVEALT
ncbi:hypothetical protein [Microcoleus anatoxicus]|uniref:Uncharacterized protein n=1 Tax=Microcoleus anatoxicus PTRS2 TaxID=2705321 RepID=A0ABU8YHD9_9CYAN